MMIFLGARHSVGSLNLKTLVPQFLKIFLLLFFLSRTGKAIKCMIYFFISSVEPFIKFLILLHFRFSVKNWIFLSEYSFFKKNIFFFHGCAIFLPSPKILTAAVCFLPPAKCLFSSSFFFFVLGFFGFTHVCSPFVLCLYLRVRLIGSFEFTVLLINSRPYCKVRWLGCYIGDPLISVCSGLFFLHPTWNIQSGFWHSGPE